MKKYILLPILFLLFSTSAHADYDSRKYLPEWVPYNYEDAVEMTDFEDCKTPLDKFDEAYFLLEWKVIPGSEEGTIYYRYEKSDPSGITGMKQLKERVESEIRDCVADYPDYVADKETEKATKLAQLEAEEEAEERAKQIQISLERCDLDFFKTFSVAEKMQTYDDRKRCEDKASEPEPMPVEFIPVAASELVVPQYTPPLAPVLIPQSAAETAKEPDVSIEEKVSASAPITTKETLELTQEELDRIVEDKLDEKLKEVGHETEPESAPNPSFLMRVANFLFGWMF